MWGKNASKPSGPGSQMTVIRANPRRRASSNDSSPQIARVLKTNELEAITDDVIEAAASILFIGN